MHFQYKVFLSVLFLAGLFLNPNLLSAQYNISGTVFDSGTGETLPAANIIISGTLSGTITNSDGKFSMEVAQLPVQIQVRYIGYESRLITVNEEKLSGLDIGLQLSVTELDEVVVTDQDPGLSIMELVIERKKLWRQRLSSYSAVAYSRQTLENDSSIVSIVESSSTSYWERDQGHAEVQHTSQQTSNISDDQNFSGVRYLPNFYDDDIEISGFELVGVTHPKALNYYDFKLLETTSMDSTPVYKIEVIPKRNLQPLFEGIVFVDGHQFALLEVDLKPNDVVRFPPPVQEFNLSYQQQYSNYGEDFWLPVDMRVSGVLRISMIGLRFPTIKFNQVSKMTDYQVNISVPDSIYQSEDRFVRADSINGTVEPVRLDPIPLTEEEQLAYETIDSTATLEEAFKPEGFLADLINDDDEDSENAIGRFTSFIPNGFGLDAGYNRVNGFSTGLNYTSELFEEKTKIELFGSYNFHSKDWNYGTKLRQELFSAQQKRVFFFAEYSDRSDIQYNSLLYNRFQNSLVTVFGGKDYFNYFRNEKVEGGFRFWRFIPKTQLMIKIASERHSSYTPGNEQDYSLFGFHESRRVNPEIDSGQLNHITTAIAYNLRSRDFGISGNRQVVARIKVSDSGLGSDFNFTHYSLELDWNWQTFFKRRFLANTLDLHVKTGVTDGTLPLQSYGALDGSVGGFSPFGTIKTRENIPYLGDRYLLATAEHNFRSIPFEILGLDYFAENGWGIILFGGAATSDSRTAFDFDVPVTKGVHTEAGVSLNGIFSIMRIDFAKRLDSPGFFIGVSVPRFF